MSAPYPVSESPEQAARIGAQGRGKPPAFPRVAQAHQVARRIGLPTPPPSALRVLDDLYSEFALNLKHWHKLHLIRAILLKSPQLSKDSKPQLNQN